MPCIPILAVIRARYDLMISEQTQLVHKYLPSDSTEDKPPLLIMLHGYGSNENDLFSMAPMLNTRASVVSLRAPHTLPWGGFAWYEIDFTQIGKGRISNVEQARKSLELLIEEIPKFHKQYGTDPDRTWIMGFSQGCILSYALSLSNPTKFSKVLALSGYILDELVPKSYKSENLGHLDYFISHGVQDEVLPVAWARTAVGILEQLQISHVYKEYPMGHGVNPECFDDMKRWMKDKGML